MTNDTVLNKVYKLLRSYRSHDQNPQINQSCSRGGERGECTRWKGWDRARQGKVAKDKAHLCCLLCTEIRKLNECGKRSRLLLFYAFLSIENGLVIYCVLVTAIKFFTAHCLVTRVSGHRLVSSRWRCYTLWTEFPLVLPMLYFDIVHILRDDQQLKNFFWLLIVAFLKSELLPRGRPTFKASVWQEHVRRNRTNFCLGSIIRCVSQTSAVR